MCGVFGVGGAACVRAAEHEVTVPSLYMHEFGVKTSYWHSLQKQRDSNGCGKTTRALTAQPFCSQSREGAMEPATAPTPGALAHPEVP